MRTVRAAILGVALLSGGCADEAHTILTRVIPNGENVIIIVATAPPGCSADSAKESALRTAAIETLRRGYDAFAFDYQKNANEDERKPTGFLPVANRLPVITSTNVASRRFSADVLLLKGQNAERADATYARDVLGSDWKDIINRPQSTNCLLYWTP